MEEDQKEDALIFMENERNSFQPGYNLMQEELRNVEVSPNLEGLRPYPLSFGSPVPKLTGVPFTDGQVSEHEMLNKLFPGINVFFTLEGPGADYKDNMEKSEMNRLDIEFLANENKKDLHLNKFFEESPLSSNQNSPREGQPHQLHQPHQPHQHHQTHQVHQIHQPQAHRPQNLQDNIYHSMNNHRGQSIPNLRSHHPHEFHQRETIPTQTTKHILQKDIQQKPSFFGDHLSKTIQNDLDRIHWNNAAFSEFAPQDVFNLNLENVILLEDLKKGSTSELENLHYKSYQALVQQLRHVIKNYQVSPKLLIQILYQQFIQNMADFFAYVKGCNSDYCLAVMKNQANNTTQSTTKSAQNTSIIQNNSTMPSNSTIPTNNVVQPVQHELKLDIPISEPQSQRYSPRPEQALPYRNYTHYETTGQATGLVVKTNPVDSSNNKSNPGNNGILGHMNGITSISVPNYISTNSMYSSPSYSSKISENTNSITSRFPSESQSVLGSEFDSSEGMSEISKKAASRKFWSTDENADLEKLCHSYYPAPVPMEKMEEFAWKYGRSVSSVQTKAQKIKRLIQTQQEKAFVESMNAAKTSGTKITTAMLSQATPNSNTGSSSIPPKIEVSRERMIKTALSHFPNKTATKEQILDKICDLYFTSPIYCVSGVPGNETWRTSVSQLLSSKKLVKKIKGTYTLGTTKLVNKDIRQTTTLKSKLIYILSLQSEYTGDFDTIKQQFWEHFRNSLSYDQEQNWEKSMRKVLVQSRMAHANQRCSLLNR